MLAGLESLPEAYQQRIVSMMEQVSWVNSSIRMALHDCYCHHIKLTNHRRTPNSFSFSSSISNPKFPKNKREQRDSSENDAYPRFLVVMRQTELPASNSKYGTNGKAVRMVPSSEVVKRSTLSDNKVKTVNGAKQNVNGAATIVKRDVNPPLTKAVKSRTSEELPPLEELKVLPSGEGFSWANENYSSWQRSIDVWSFVLSLRIRVLLDNAKWAYIRGFTEDKQVGSYTSLISAARKAILTFLQHSDSDIRLFYLCLFFADWNLFGYIFI
nr:protein ACTIVITY OF BC1 COMPLEX KINASE 7, chloroplastic-like [Arachis hypogaea]